MKLFLLISLLASSAAAQVDVFRVETEEVSCDAARRRLQAERAAAIRELNEKKAANEAEFSRELEACAKDDADCIDWAKWRQSVRFRIWDLQNGDEMTRLEKAEIDLNYTGACAAPWVGGNSCQDARAEEQEHFFSRTAEYMKGQLDISNLRAHEESNCLGDAVCLADAQTRSNGRMRELQEQRQAEDDRHERILAEISRMNCTPPAASPPAPKQPPEPPRKRSPPRVSHPAPLPPPPPPRWTYTGKWKRPSAVTCQDALFQEQEETTARRRLLMKERDAIWTQFQREQSACANQKCIAAAVASARGALERNGLEGREAWALSEMDRIDILEGACSPLRQTTFSPPQTPCQKAVTLEDQKFAMEAAGFRKRHWSGMDRQWREEFACGSNTACRKNARLREQAREAQIARESREALKRRHNTLLALPQCRSGPAPQLRR